MSCSLFFENNFDFTLFPGKPIVFVSDIDETYLRTNFRSLGGLISTAFQFAIDKIVFPGMTPFFKTIRKIQGSALYFISASPMQMARVLNKKFLLEEIPFDGLMLRNWAETIKQLRFSDLKKPFGYKLFAILSLIHIINKSVDFVFIGDDFEYDADIYNTILKISRHEFNALSLTEFLKQQSINIDCLNSIVSLFGSINFEFSVSSIFIRQIRSNKEASQLMKRFPEIIMFKEPIVMAEVLRDKGILSSELFNRFLGNPKFID